MNIYSYVGGDNVQESDCDVCEELCEHPQAICLAKAEIISNEAAQQLAETFKILGDTTRVKILQILGKKELCVCDIAVVVQMSQSAVSHQLRLLRSARLVKYRKTGKMVCYSLDDSHISTLIEQGIQHISHR